MTRHEKDLLQRGTATFPDYRPLLPDDLEALDNMTRKELSDQNTVCWFAFWRYGPQWYASAKKHEMVDHVRYQMRAWAGWLCVLLLDDEQLDLFHLWLIEAHGKGEMAWEAKILYEQWTSDVRRHGTQYVACGAYEMARRHFTRRAGFLVYWQFCEEMRPLGRIYPPKLYNV